MEQTDVAEKRQRYKIGLCVLEEVKLAKSSGWAEEDDGDDDGSGSDGFHLLEAVSH